MGIFKKVKFKDFATLQRGFDLPTETRIEGEYPVIGSTSINGYHNEFKVKAPCVTTGRSGALGDVLYIEQNCWPLNTTLWIKDFKGNNPKFVYFKLKTLGLKELNSGAGIPTLNRNHLDEIVLEVPDFFAQTQIASVLSTYDDLIENNEKRIKILEEMAQLLYTEWFVKFKFPGHEKVKMVDSGTAFGMVPEGWEVAKIQDLYETSSGGTPSRRNESEFYINATIPWVKTKELNDNYILDTEEKITEIAVKKSAAKKFPKNTVLIAMYGATIGKLGILSVEATTNQACCAFLPKKELFSSFYIYQYLKNNIKKITSLAFGAAQPNISQHTIKNIDILKPESEILEAYNKIIESIFNKILSIQKQNKNLSVFRDLLIPQLVTGKRELK